MFTERVAQAGAGVTVVATNAAFFINYLPVVQFFSALVAIGVGIATGAYYIAKLRSEARFESRRVDTAASKESKRIDAAADIDRKNNPYS